jgi:hypothetical protein
MQLRPADHFFRAAVCHYLLSVGKNRYSGKRGLYGSTDEVAKKFWPDDQVTPVVLRAASNPATLATSSWAGALATQAVSDAVISLAGPSAAATLARNGLRVSLDGYGSLLIPRRVTVATDAGNFLGEASPIPVRQLDFSGGPTLSPFKWGTIAEFTEELSEYSIQTMTLVIRRVLQDAIALNLDAAIFSSTASSSIRPAGILAGLSTLTPTTGGGANALARDVEQLIATLVTNGGGVNPAFICAAGQAAAMKLYAGPRFDAPILPSAALAANTVIVVDQESFISAFGDVPEFQTSNEATLHEDTAPTQISSTSTAVAAPVRSLWQTATIAMRCIFRVSWGLRAAHVAFISGTTW